MESETGRVEAFVLFRDVGVAWEISFLAVAPELRGQGRMRTLLLLLQERLQERLRETPRQQPQGLAIWLEVHEANGPALNLYAKVGFREVGRRPRYYSDGGAAILFSYG
jgi:ribosomal-protein-alanine N-acetyltransferase